MSLVKPVDQWVTSPYCFCKDLPWLVLSGIPAVPTALAGGWGWEDWAILAAALIALAFFLFLLFLLLCLLCPGGICCGPAGFCCGRNGVCCCGGAKDEKKKMGLSSAQAVEMSSLGGSDASNLTAVDLKLPRAWMDASKGDISDDRGDMGLGTGSFGKHKAWSSDNALDASAALAHRSANSGNQLQGRSAAYSFSARSRFDEDGFGPGDGGSADGSARLDYYRNQSAATIMSPSHGGKAREAAHEWRHKSTSETRRLVESKQTRNDDRFGRDNKGFEARELSFARGRGGGGGAKETDPAYSTVQDSMQRQANSLETNTVSNLALVKHSASSSGAASGSANTVVTSGGDGTPVVQCYTVTKKVTTTTYGDDEGDEVPKSSRTLRSSSSRRLEVSRRRLKSAETAVVTTTEKKWREGMNEVGEISVAASASAGELLPSIGAPAAVLNDTSRVHTVKSLTNVEGGASNVVRRYEFQQTSHDRDTLL